MLVAVPTPLDCRRQAFTCHNIPPRFRVFAVPFAAVRYAGVPHASRPLVGATTKYALARTAAVFCAETLAFGGGGAARHGARLLSTAVFAAMRRSTTVCVGGASFKLARSIRAMLGTDAVCVRKSGAAFLLAHFLAATAVLAASASGFDGTGALVERAGPK